MTGTYPGFTGIKHVLSKWDDDTYLDPKKFNSFANQLKKAGYATAVAGKWNISWLERNDTVKALASMNIAFGKCMTAMASNDRVTTSPISA